MDSWNEKDFFFFMLMNLIPEEISSAQLDSNEQKPQMLQKSHSKNHKIFKTHPSITAALAGSSVTPRLHRQNNGLEPQPEAQRHCNRIDMHVAAQ